MVSAGRDKGRIGHQHGMIREIVTAKCDAEIDRDPGAVVAVQRQVHADFAGTAQGQE